VDVWLSRLCDKCVECVYLSLNFAAAFICVFAKKIFTPRALRS